MMTNRIFQRFPALFFFVAALVIANNIFRFSPPQVLKSPLNIIVPGLMIVFGTTGVILNRKARLREREEAAQTTQRPPDL